MDVWARLRHLFNGDDGSLPDIFVEGVSPEESVKIYSWVVSLAKPYGEPYLWSLAEEKEIRISEIPNPALYYIQGKSESFRHGLEVFSFSGCRIPQLSIGINESGLEFDYRMGREWGKNELEALLDFLCCIKKMAPSAKITQADEGSYEYPNAEFSYVFEEYFDVNGSS